MEINTSLYKLLWSRYFIKAIVILIRLVFHPNILLTTQAVHLRFREISQIIGQNVLYELKGQGICFMIMSSRYHRDLGRQEC